MMVNIRLVEPKPPVAPVGLSNGSNALDLAGSAELQLKFAIEVSDSDELEALRHARRSMLREEWTRGRDGEEPSLEDAIFSPGEIAWSVRPEQRGWCLQKVQELTARANRSLAEVSRS